MLSLLLSYSFSSGRGLINDLFLLNLRHEREKFKIGQDSPPPFFVTIRFTSITDKDEQTLPFILFSEK
jgi:hypothetical protein